MCIRDRGLLPSVLERAAGGWPTRGHQLRVGAGGRRERAPLRSRSDEIAFGCQPGLAAEPRREGLWRLDTAILGLAVFKDRDQAAANGEAGAVQGVDELGLATCRACLLYTSRCV